ncbi:MAG: hypothetical protein JSU63_18420 [Phycisphaerales bacterium]|nr:MAG: hypothetical protein JSU63_18420 [Phycisphaerales bacterium]
MQLLVIKNTPHNCGSDCKLAQRLSSLMITVSMLAQVGGINGQPLCNILPDWSSTDTGYSTSGASIDVAHDGWLVCVV